LIANLAMVKALQLSLRDHWRAARLRAFMAALDPQPTQRILDLGGNLEMWASTERPLNLTLLNTDVGHATAGRPSHTPQHGTTWHFVTGDACDLDALDDGCYDIVFSNSVIEHVGDDARVAAFARGVRRVGKAYWVQTPSPWFPIEAHTGWPLFWQYPNALQKRLVQAIDHRRQHEPWFCPMAQTRCFSLKQLQAWFPDAQRYTERVLGFSKSWSMFRASR
jgi:SAM-dependent methyltransferase